jgi:hypothetical protein
MANWIRYLRSEEIREQFPAAICCTEPTSFIEAASRSFSHIRSSGIRQALSPGRVHDRFCAARSGTPQKHE